MNNEHITNILDKTAFADLSTEDLAAVNLHAAGCAACREAFAAARVSALLLKMQAADAPQPSPFFQAKVINALRQKGSLKKPFDTLRRWWQASAALVFSMLATLGVVVTLTAFAPSEANEVQASGANYNLYSAETVIFNQKPAGEMTSEQVFEVIYETKNDFEKQ